MKVGIVTTLRDPGIALRSFITYHQAIGFHLIYLFFDDPNDPAIDIAKEFDSVVISVQNEDLRNRWKNSRLLHDYPDYARFINVEHMARQILNAELAIRMCLQDGIKWLLHIDADELFYWRGTDVSRHFEDLESHGMKAMTYLNHEAIPEVFSVGDMFKEVTLFKINERVLTIDQKEYLFNSSYFLRNNLFFRFYSEGKSAAMITDELLPEGVHLFNSNTTLNVVDEPAILHYPICGFHTFKTKYSNWGAFNDKPFDSGGRLQFDKTSRDVLSSNNPTAFVDLYKNHVMLNDAAVIDDLMTKKVFKRFTEPAGIVKKS